MTSDPSNYHREYSPYGSFSLFEFEGSDLISVLKNSIEYSFVFFKCFTTRRSRVKISANQSTLPLVLFLNLLLHRWLRQSIARSIM